MVANQTFEGPSLKELMSSNRDYSDKKSQKRYERDRKVRIMLNHHSLAKVNKRKKDLVRPNYREMTRRREPEEIERIFCSFAFK